MMIMIQNAPDVMEASVRNRNIWNMSQQR